MYEPRPHFTRPPFIVLQVQHGTTRYTHVHSSIDCDDGDQTSPSIHPSVRSSPAAVTIRTRAPAELGYTTTRPPQTCQARSNMKVTCNAAPVELSQQPRELLLQMLDHGVRTFLHLQTLRDHMRLDIWHDGPGDF